MKGDMSTKLAAGIVLLAIVGMALFLGQGRECFAKLEDGAQRQSNLAGAALDATVIRRMACEAEQAFMYRAAGVPLGEHFSRTGGY